MSLHPGFIVVLVLVRTGSESHELCLMHGTICSTNNPEKTKIVCQDYLPKLCAHQTAI